MTYWGHKSAINFPNHDAFLPKKAPKSATRLLLLNPVCCLGQFGFRWHSCSCPSLPRLSPLDVAPRYHRHSMLECEYEFWGHLDHCRRLHSNMFYFISHFRGFVAGGSCTAWIWVKEGWIPGFYTCANWMVISESWERGCISSSDLRFDGKINVWILKIWPHRSLEINRKYLCIILFLLY